MTWIHSAITQPTLRVKSSPTAIKPLEESESLLLHLELARQLDGLPRDLGVTLLLLGAFGVVIPGPVPPGFSFMLLGVIALRPTILARFGAPMARQFPKMFRLLIGFVTQFRVDLAHRYPGSVSDRGRLSDQTGPTATPRLPQC